MSLVLRQVRGYQQGRKSVAGSSKLQQELKETKKQLNSILTKWKFGDQPIKSAPEFLSKFEPWINSQLEQKREHQEQLRAINLLFDENAKDYETIDFNGLYALLSSIAERERENKSKWWK